MTVANKTKSNEFSFFLCRVVYMLQQDPPQINLKSVEHLIIDESDKLFEAGVRGFRDQVKNPFLTPSALVESV